MRATTLGLGPRTVDIGRRALVVGVLDVGSDGGAVPGDLIRRADRMVDEGADVLELDGGASEEGDGPRALVAAVAALAARFDVALAVATCRARAAAAAFDAGALVASYRSGPAGPEDLRAVARAGTTVVLGAAGAVGPGDGRPDDVAAAVADVLAGRARMALDAGIAADRIVLDAGLDRGRTPAHALALLRASDRLADLGHPLQLSVPDPSPEGARGDGGPWGAALGATALGVILGCRLVRVRDVAEHRQACAILAALEGTTAR